MTVKLTGEYVLPVNPELAYRALNDREMLERCIPGCEQLEQRSDVEFAAIVKLQLGPLKARFKGKVRLEDLDPPNGYRIVGEGEGGVAGFAKGAATITLRPVAEGTQLTYNADANVGGKIAQLGQRLLASTTKKVADQFFENLVTALGSSAGAAAGATSEHENPKTAATN